MYEVVKGGSYSLQKGGSYSPPPNGGSYSPQKASRDLLEEEKQDGYALFRFLRERKNFVETCRVVFPTREAVSSSDSSFTTQSCGKHDKNKQVVTSFTRKKAHAFKSRGETSPIPPSRKRGISTGGKPAQTSIDDMAPFCPHYTAATLKPSHLNVTIDAIRKTKDCHAHIHAIAIRLSAQTYAMTMRYATSALPATTTDAQAPATDLEDAGCSDWSSTTDDHPPADEEIVWNKAAGCDPTSEDGELSHPIEDNAETRQTSLGDQIAPLGSLENYWTPWESELLQDEYWDSVGL